MRCIVLFATFVVVCNARSVVKRGAQSPKVWDALEQLKGKNAGLSVDQIQELYLTVKPGEDFPILMDIPAANVDCGSVKAGFYANDGAGRCQAFDRCDINGNLTSYLCPAMSLFNQITLICDWWYNVDCAKSRSFYDYSNSRLYDEKSVLLDSQDDFVAQATGAVKISVTDDSKTKGKGKKNSKKVAA